MISEKKGMTTYDMMSHIRFLNAITLFRIAFGIVWLIDGAMKFVWLQPSDVIKLVQVAGHGQSGWLQPWFNFWMSSMGSAPGAYLYGIGLMELALGLALVIGFLRKSAYFGGVILSLMIWATVEGFSHGSIFHSDQLPSPYKPSQKPQPQAATNRNSKCMK